MVDLQSFEILISTEIFNLILFQLSGTLRLVMKPLINQMPMIGGVQYFFLNPPSLEFNLIGVADVFDMPGLSDLIRRIVQEQISNM